LNSAAGTLDLNGPGPPRPGASSGENFHRNEPAGPCLIFSNPVGGLSGRPQIS